MTEQEYLTGIRPGDMLDFVTENPDHQGITCCRSARKMALIRDAWASPLCGPERYCLGIVGAGRDRIDTACQQEAVNIKPAYREVAARLLREIVGNPFRPLIVHDRDEGGYPTRPDWLTPLALQMAQTIYDERDFASLPILADALQEAGCPPDVACPRECKPAGGGRAFAPGGWREGATVMVYACDCGDGRAPNPLLAHLRIAQTDRHSPRCGTAHRGCAPDCPKGAWERNGPHVLGCWALDLLLGKE